MEKMQTTSNEFAPAELGGVDNVAQNNNAGLLALTAGQNMQIHARHEARQLEPIGDGLNQRDLTSYLQSYLSADFKPSATKQLLGPLGNTDPSLIEASIESEFQKSKGRFFNSVVDFRCDGSQISEALTKSADRLWFALQTNSGKQDASVDNNAPKRSQAFGRVVQIRSLTPITVLQLLVSLSDYFDVQRVFSTFINKGPSICYHPNSAIRMGDTWFFCIKYYYLSSKGSNAYLGQQSGSFHERKMGIQICRGSSSVALQFEGNEDGDEMSSCAMPWRLWVNSCAQDDPSPLPNALGGVQAYLWGVNHELANVRRSLRSVSHEIALIAVPSDEYLFDNELRESVLFEDEGYTNSRTYFWALQSLRIVNECINSLITAWEMSNTSHILCGGQAETQETSTESRAQEGEIARMDKVKFYLAAIEGQMKKLKELVQENERRQEEIIALRDGLFNASAVLEARTTVTQGENIRILTYVSMLFLPASFSTSVFGMQSILPASTSIHAFAIVIVCVCGPTYLLIWFLSRRKGQKFATATKRTAKHVLGADYWTKSRQEWVKRREWLDKRKKEKGNRKVGDIEKGKDRDTEKRNKP